MGARGCIAEARVQGLVETGAGCPPGSSGNPGRAAAAGPELAVVGTGAALAAAVAGIGAGGACGVRSPLPSGAGSDRSAGGPVATVVSGETAGALGDAWSTVEPVATAVSGETPGVLGGAWSTVEPSRSPLAAGYDGGADRNRWVRSVSGAPVRPGTDAAPRTDPSSLQPGSSARVGRREGCEDGDLRHAGAL